MDLIINIMSDWNRLYEACKDATGKEIDDIYDAHLVVEELDFEVRRLKAELAKVPKAKKKKAILQEVILNYHFLKDC